MACGRKKCMRPGRITNNGYLNFLREYRRKVCGLSPTETVRRGARAWNRLTCTQKARYRRMGCRKRTKRRRRKKKCRRSRPKKRKSCGKRRRKSRRRGCSKRRKRRRRRRGGCGRRKRCMKPGPVTNNGYLNFLRWFRKKRCGLSPNEAIRQGARKWCSLSQCEKDRFRRMACKAKSTSRRRKRSRLCRKC